VARASEYYRDVLGFEIELAPTSEVRFGIVTRGASTVMLRFVDGSRIVPNEAQGGTWDAFFWVTGVRALHEELARRGATIVYGPTVQHAYHMEEFAVRDADGHVHGFGEPVAPG
jgi:catechol 2,3-dioxygenase-like lactoylglutathione lyase family enzyme